jgi:hypothetical protein
MVPRVGFVDLLSAANVHCVIDYFHIILFAFV